MLRYREDNGKVFTDVYEIKDKMNVQIPNKILTVQQTIMLEFCFLSKTDNSRITVSRKIALNVVDTIDNIVEQNDVVVGTNITDLVQKVINEIKAGKEELENIGNLAVAKIKAQEKESSETLAQNLEKHKQALEEKKEEIIGEISGATSGNIGDVNTAKDNALREIREKKDTVVAELESNKTQQVKVVTQAGEKAVKSVSDTKDNALGEIEETKNSVKLEIKSDVTTIKKDITTHGNNVKDAIDRYTSVKEQELDAYSDSEKLELSTYADDKKL